MKTLKDILEGSLLDDIENTLSTGVVKVPHTLIREYIKSNYDISGNLTISEKPNKDGLYEVNSDNNVTVKNKQITSLVNDLFIWGTISGDFNCFRCNSLKSLEGGPKIVEGFFSCSYCKSLTSLEGCPKTVGGYFSCCYCNSLKSLEGAPEHVKGSFNCYDCKSLTSLKGCPKIVEGNFGFYRNKLKVSKITIKMKCKIKGNIVLE